MKIHGKEYTEVKDRILVFREKHPDWSVVTEVHAHGVDMAWVLFHAWLVNPDETQQFHGWAYEERTPNDAQDVNFASWVENCETSAIGRALANMGLTGSSERPSKEEMDKVDRAVKSASAKSAVVPTITEKSKPLLIRKVGTPPEDKMTLFQRNFVELRRAIVTMVGHDKYILQAMVNRGISDIANVKSVTTISELCESMDNFLGQVAELIASVGHGGTGAIKDLPVDVQEEVRLKMDALALLM